MEAVELHFLEVHKSWADKKKKKKKKKNSNHRMKTV